MRLSTALTIALISFTSVAMADNPIPEKRLSLVRDVDLPGGDIQSIFDTTLNACERACLTNESCVAFTFNTRSNSCFPKASVGEEAPYEGAFSGYVLGTDPAVLAKGETREAELRSFLRQADIDAATRLAVDLTNKHVPNNCFWLIHSLHYHFLHIAVSDHHTSTVFHCSYRYCYRCLCPLPRLDLLLIRLRLFFF